MMMTPWKHQRVLIVGVARQGLALARYLAAQGAEVTLNDERTAEQLAGTRQALADLQVSWALGGHPLTLLDGADQICVSGGVPLTLPLIAEALRRGMPVTNDSQIFMEAVACKVIGITGSAGKTTTTTLVGRIAEQSIGLLPGLRKVWVGGNIGLPLVEYLDDIDHHDLVILELSSFQLELMTISPQVGAVLNITPNHLDRHGTMEAYAAAKARLLDFQSAGDVAILNREDSGAWALKDQIHGQLMTFGMQPPAEGLAGTFAAGDSLYVTHENVDRKVLSKESIALRGQHNQMNVLAASAIAIAAGLPIEAIAAGVQGFGGVAHRLELVRTLHGVRWYNNTIATAPERTIAAIRAFDEPLIVMLGGRDKNLPWEDLAALLRARVDHVVVFGEASEKILRAIGTLHAAERPYTVVQCHGLAEAVQAAAQVAEAGDVVLLSPGGTSFDEFKDFEERGERFRQWVNQLD